MYVWCPGSFADGKKRSSFSSRMILHVLLCTAVAVLQKYALEASRTAKKRSSFSSRMILHVLLCTAVAVLQKYYLSIQRRLHGATPTAAVPTTSGKTARISTITPDLGHLRRLRTETGDIRRLVLNAFVRAQLLGR